MRLIGRLPEGQRPPRCSDGCCRHVRTPRRPEGPCLRHGFAACTPPRCRPSTTQCAGESSRTTRRSTSSSSPAGRRGRSSGPRSASRSGAGPGDAPPRSWSGLRRRSRRSSTSPALTGSTRSGTSSPTAGYAAQRRSTCAGPTSTSTPPRRPCATTPPARSPRTLYTSVLPHVSQAAADVVAALLASSRETDAKSAPDEPAVRRAHTLHTHVETERTADWRVEWTNPQVRLGRAGGARTHDPRIMSPLL